MDMRSRNKEWGELAEEGFSVQKICQREWGSRDEKRVFSYGSHLSAVSMATS